MSTSDNCLFHEAHLWCRPADDGTLEVGISDYAQEKLGDILYFDLPEIGTQVERGASIGTVESAKVVNDLISPISGNVRARNDSLEDRPDLANSDPYGGGWLVRIQQASDNDTTDGLMDINSYRAYLEG